MTCATCGTENPERARFCMSCGSPLPSACPGCGTENPPGAKFCIECGADARRRRRRPRPPPPTAEQPPEERRKATVLFADLSGYTAVAERLDPERIKSLVDRALAPPRRRDRALRRHDRQVHRRQRDGRLRRAGRPRGRPRARRARRPRDAGGDGRRSTSEIAADVGADFTLRVGINSGEVLAGRVGDGYTVIGDPVNVAARLQAAAEPGTVIVGEVTHRLTRAAIEYVRARAARAQGQGGAGPRLGGGAGRGSRPRRAQRRAADPAGRPRGRDRACCCRCSTG